MVSCSCSRRLGQQEGGGVMMVLCGQRIQPVHDHGGRRVGEAWHWPAYHRTSRAYSAGTHCTGVLLVTARREGNSRTNALGREQPRRRQNARTRRSIRRSLERGQGLLIGNATYSHRFYSETGRAANATLLL